MRRLDLLDRSVPTPIPSDASARSRAFVRRRPGAVAIAALGIVSASACGGCTYGEPGYSERQDAGPRTDHDAGPIFAGVPPIDASVDAAADADP